jgi:DNA polymerase eta
MTATEAKKLCPEIHLAHVATWKAGESHWAYRASPNVNDSKACLDPYRAESKKILSIFQTKCPNARTEKASIDESFLDLSKDIYDQLLLQYEALRAPGNPNENLPLPDVQALDWAGSHLVANEEVDGEDVDWDDVAMAIGAGIVKGLRDEVFKQLGYTCSAGIASNKMIAKLGAGYKKPDQQVSNTHWQELAHKLILGVRASCECRQCNPS